MISELRHALADTSDGAILVVTGAGISRASGIPTFRGSEPGAVWKVSDVELATCDYFLRDPVGQWQWYLERFRRVDGARPNLGHTSLASLENWQSARGGRFQLVTQNIDTLHEQAGSQSLIKIHGTSDRLRCSRAGCELGAPSGSIARDEVDLDPFLDRPSNRRLPRCPICDSILRAHVLFFDEFYQEHFDYRFDGAMQAAEEATVVLFVGTSFSVGITDFICRAAMSRATPMFSIDPASSPQARMFGVVEIDRPAEDALPALLRDLTSVSTGPPG